MKYSTIEIKLDLNGNYYTRCTDLPYDREPTEGACSPIGFFHYPRKLGKKKAFDKLKKTMIQAHKDQITKALAHIEKISALYLPNE